MKDKLIKPCIIDPIIDNLFSNAKDDGLLFNPNYKEDNIKLKNQDTNKSIWIPIEEYKAMEEARINGKLYIPKSELNNVQDI